MSGSAAWNSSCSRARRAWPSSGGVAPGTIRACDPGIRKGDLELTVREILQRLLDVESQVHNVKLLVGDIADIARTRL